MAGAACTGWCVQDHDREGYRLLRAILNTAVTVDELIAANPCRIKGAGEQRAAERPALTIGRCTDLPVSSLTGGGRSSC